jgi:hypothetical protein
MKLGGVRKSSAASAFLPVDASGSKLFERGHRLKNGVIAHWSGARRNASDGGRPEATNQGTPIDGGQTVQSRLIFGLRGQSNPNEAAAPLWAFGE